MRLTIGKLACVSGAVGGLLIAGTMTAAADNSQGIIDGAQPTGYISSPASYDISGGPVTVTVNETATNLTTQTQDVPIQMNVHHFLTLNGVDISNGQPGQPGITWLPGMWMQTTSTLVGQTPLTTLSFPPSGTLQLQYQWTFTSCGYYQLDITGRPPFLGAAYIRVLGCGAGTGTRLTPGFWKNHASATSALLPQTLGGWPVSTFASAQAIFDAMKCSAPANCLAAHLLAAELDMAAGSATCILPVVNDANALLSSIGYHGVANYTLTSAQATQALSDEVALDNYTNDSNGPTC